MDPLEFKEVAEAFKDSPHESRRRTSVSRAYYAVFHYIKSYFDPNGQIFPQDAKAHGALTRHLRELGHPLALSIAKRVTDLRVDRDDADYQIQMTKFTRDFAELTYKKSDGVILDFDNAVKSKIID